MQRLNLLNTKNPIILLCFVVLSFAGCSKGGDTPSPEPPVEVAEPNITFKVDISGSEVNYSNVFTVVGTSVTMNANITSILPKNGVTIDVIVKKKLDNSVMFSTNLSSSAASNPITVTGLAPGVLCVASVTITSKSKLSNSSLKTFELAAK